MGKVLKSPVIVQGDLIPNDQASTFEMYQEVSSSMKIPYMISLGEG
jgi:hypothetical protein